MALSVEDAVFKNDDKRKLGIGLLHSTSTKKPRICFQARVGSNSKSHHFLHLFTVAIDTPVTSRNSLNSIGLLEPCNTEATRKTHASQTLLPKNLTELGVKRRLQPSFLQQKLNLVEKSESNPGTSPRGFLW